MVRGQFALAIVVHQLRDGNSLRAQVRAIQIDFPAQRRDLVERRRFVGELCGRTDHHPSMFPLAISSCLSPSKFPNIGTARATCAKIRSLMSVVFNHAIRHQVFSCNPIRLVRQSAKRRKIPAVLSVSEVQQLLDALALRERTLVLLDVGTGLRMSELFGLKWKDVDFDANEISVVRSIVMQVTGPCKTESSQKPISLDPYLAEALRAWLEHVRYNRTIRRRRTQAIYWCLPEGHVKAN